MYEDAGYTELLQISEEEMRHLMVGDWALIGRPTHFCITAMGQVVLFPTPADANIRLRIGVLG